MRVIVVRYSVETSIVQVRYRSREVELHALGVRLDNTRSRVACSYAESPKENTNRDMVRGRTGYDLETRCEVSD
jgi:hypothetical protein